MNRVLHGLHYRLLWAAMFLAFTVSALREFAGQPSLEPALSAVGMTSWAVAGFLQPVDLRATLRTFVARSEAYRIGPPALHGGATLVGLMAFAASLALKYSGTA